MFMSKKEPGAEDAGSGLLESDFSHPLNKDYLERLKFLMAVQDEARAELALRQDEELVALVLSFPESPLARAYLEGVISDADGQELVERVRQSEKRPAPYGKK